MGRSVVGWASRRTQVTGIKMEKFYLAPARLAADSSHSCPLPSVSSYVQRNPLNQLVTWVALGLAQGDLGPSPSVFLVQP